MKPLLEEIEVQNFKSFKNTKIKFRSFNVVIGPNGSGKSNLVDLFKFLKKAIGEKLEPYAPYLEWWNYRNLVWGGREDLPIKITLKFNVKYYKVNYYVAFIKIEDEFKVLEEVLEIPGYTKIQRKGNLVTIINNPEIIDKYYEKLRDELNELIKKMSSGMKFLDEVKELSVNELINLLKKPQQFMMFPSEKPRLRSFDLFEISRLTMRNKLALPVVSFVIPLEKDAVLEIQVMYIRDEKPRLRLSGLILPYVEELEEKPLRRKMIDIKKWCSSIIALKPINVDEVKIPRSPSGMRSDRLSDKAENLVLILHNLYLKRDGLPERIKQALKIMFPDIQIGFDQMRDGRLFLKILQYNHELNPPCISDGLYKVLIILTALELNPSVLIIDEIENSLHARPTLEYLIDELKNSGLTVVLTTHSPVIVDMVEPQDLIFVEMTPDGSVFKKIEEPEKAKAMLRRLGITQSEAWLYGELKLGKA